MREPSLISVILDAPVWDIEPLVERVVERRSRPVSAGTVKYVLLELASHHNPERNGSLVWPSVERLAALTGLGINTVRAALHVLCQLQFVKIRSDFGRVNGYSINEDVIRSTLTRLTTDDLRRRRAAVRSAENDPSHHGRGLPFDEPDPSHHGRGTPPTMGGDPSHHGRVPLPPWEGNVPKKGQGTAKGNGQPDIPPLGHSPFPKISDGDHQLKMPLLGYVARGALRELAGDRERPTGEEPGTEAPGEVSALPAGMRRVRERPG